MWERDGEEMCRGMGGDVGEGWGGGNSEGNLWSKFVLSARDGGDSPPPQAQDLWKLLLMAAPSFSLSSRNVLAV